MVRPCESLIIQSMIPRTLFTPEHETFRDTQIAGIALSRRATLATRNMRHFQDLRVPVVDPWQTEAR